jgi:hypothetical protein
MRELPAHGDPITLQPRGLVEPAAPTQTVQAGTVAGPLVVAAHLRVSARARPLHARVPGVRWRELRAHEDDEGSDSGCDGAG